MSDLREALLYLELDKAGDAPGPLFEEPRRLLARDPRLRAGWNQFQALRALALETAPDPGEKLVRAALLHCRREQVSRELARASGDEDLARSILLGQVPENRGLPSWLLGILLLGSLVLGYLVFRNDWLGLAAPSSNDGRASTPGLMPSAEEKVPFEFPVQTPPADAALAAPQDETVSSDVDDTHNEPPAARQARRLVREHLFEAQARERAEEDGGAEAPAPRPDPTPKLKAVARVQPLPTATMTEDPGERSTDDATPMPLWVLPTFAPTRVPTPTPTAVPTSVPTAVPTSVPTAVPTAAPTSRPTPVPTALPSPLPVRRPSAAATPSPRPSPAAPRTPTARSLAQAPLGLTLSSGTLETGASLDIGLGLPQRKEIELRLFDPAGKSVRLLAVGAFGPGEQHFPLDAKNDAGQPLAPGTYYLRVMTPWFSRVEPIQIQ